MITFFMVAAEQWEKVAYYFKLKKQLKPVMVILHAILFSLEDAVVHLTVSNTIWIPTIEN